MSNNKSPLTDYFNTQTEHTNPASAYIPMVVEKTTRGAVSQDLFSRLLQERIILLDGPINDGIAASVKAQMQYLESADPNKDIHLYINSPGGIVTSGLAIFDTMKSLKCDVATYGIGQNCSMGSFLLAAGTKGKLCPAEHAHHDPPALRRYAGTGNGHQHSCFGNPAHA